MIIYYSLYLPNVIVRVDTERVQIKPHRARKYDSILRYDGNFVSQIVQPNRIDRHRVDADLARSEID